MEGAIIGPERLFRKLIPYFRLEMAVAGTRDHVLLWRLPRGIRASFALGDPGSSSHENVND